MKKKLFLSFLILSFNLPGFCTDFPQELKNILKKKFPEISFKIDNSFSINHSSYLFLIPSTAINPKKLEIIYSIPDKADKKLPKLIWFSNDYVFVKILKLNNETLSIVDLKEVSNKYKERFLKTKLPSDLVVPKGFVLKSELSNLIGELPIEIRNGASVQQNGEEQKIQLDGTLYLTSPDTGKIVYLNLSDLSMIYHIQTLGAPWEISFDKTSETIFVTDFAKDQIYQIKPMENKILKTYPLLLMSSPRYIELSSNGSLVFLLQSLSNDFAVYDLKEENYIIKTKLPPSPKSFSQLKDQNLIAITCPTTDKLVFLDSNDFSILNQIMIAGGPEKIISDPSGKTLYIANRNGNNITEFDVENKKVKATLKVEETPVSLVLHPNKKWLYVGNGKSNSISVINLESGMTENTINLSAETQFPGDLVITTDGRWLIITSETTNTISIIDLNLKKPALKLDVGATTHAAYLIDRKAEHKETEK